MLADPGGEASAAAEALAAAGLAGDHFDQRHRAVLGDVFQQSLNAPGERILGLEPPGQPAVRDPLPREMEAGVNPDRSSG
jgi:hypothetical protein